MKVKIVSKDALISACCGSKKSCLSADLLAGGDADFFLEYLRKIQGI